MAVAAIAAPFVAGAMGASALTIAGLAISAVGVVSGNKKIAMIGGLIGLAGGFLSSGALAGEATTTLATGGAEAATAASAADAATTTSQALDSASMSGEIVSGGDPVGTAVQEVSGGGVTQPQAQLAAQPPATQMVVQPPSAPIATQPGDQLVTGMDLAADSHITGAGNNPFFASQQAPGGGMVEKIMDWAKANPFLAYGAMQTGGRMLQAGFTEDPNAARVAHLNSIELAELQRRTNNMNGVTKIRPLNVANPNASPYKNNYPYVSPAVGMIEKFA